MVPNSKTNNTKAQFTCQYCHKVFVLEQRFMHHVCKPMMRERDIQSPDGQAAFIYYMLWFRALNRGTPSHAAFGASKLFNAFIEFVRFARSVSLPAPEKFIWLMVQKTFQPSMWRGDEVYAIYMEYLDRQIPPLDQISMSFKVIASKAAFNDIDLSEVFSLYTTNELIHMVRTRQLSPWMLLFSKKFRGLMDTMSTEQRLVMENLIRPNYWAAQFQDHKAQLTTVKMLVHEMGI